MVLKVISLLFLILFSTRTLLSQNNTSHIWSNFETGFSTGGLTFGGELNFLMSELHLFKLQYIEASEANFILFKSPPEYTKSFNLLYGRRLGESIVNFSLSGGIGYITGLKRGKYIKREFLGGIYESKLFETMGLILQAEFNFTSQFIGFGLVFNTNFNNVYPTFGILISLSFGQIRD